ncbi:MAG: enterotoxin [Opitutae bacterium]|nr:enterotoxin [Opitutae bacterium]
MNAHSRSRWLPRFLAATAGLLLAQTLSAAADTATVSLDNGTIAATWPLEKKRPAAGQVRDTATGQTLAVGPEQFWLRFGAGETVGLGTLAQEGSCRTEPLATEPKASRAALHLPGQRVTLRLSDEARHCLVTWQAELREGSRYLRLRVEVTNTGTGDLPLTGIGWGDLALAGATVVGSFNGSPVVAGQIFAGIEHPLAENRVDAGRVRCVLPQLNPLRPGETAAIGVVVGFTDAGQLRRGFLTYLERERARPYRQFLHYNTWYSLGFLNPFSETDLLGAMQTFDRELIQKRGAKFDAYVLDDGWDDPKTLWQFHSKFPQGLKNVSATAAATKTGIGLWLSPWGGYGKPKLERLKYGEKEGFEVRDGSFAMAGPRYYERFRARCVSAMRDDNVVYFKFDGIGSNDETGRIDAGAGRDFDAMLRLVAELRAINPDVYINQTTGTWPSPFWLLQVDSIWRDGNDHHYAGFGTERQRWLTYRDWQTYRNVVVRGPLFPLNSLMSHGVVFAHRGTWLKSATPEDFAAEVRTYFGSGTQLQELYLSPQLLSPRHWDDLAAAARWARANAEILRDTHWVGGDPSQLAVYGWAAWSPQKGILTLRNPDSRPATIAVDVEKFFELPAGAARVYAVTSPFADAPAPVNELRAGTTTSVTLPPYGVLVLEATPR